MKKFLFAVVALTVLFLVSYQPKVFIGTENQTIAIMNAEDNLPLTINFMHSVQKTPVIEELEYQNGEFALRRTRYKSQGVGLPFDESDGRFRREGEWFVVENMNRRFKRLELRTGKDTQLKISLNGQEYELYRKYPPGTKIIVKTF